MAAPVKSSPSRVPDAELTARILDAAEEILRSEGFASMRVEHVAAKVQCGKTAIYRRWSGKEELAAAVVQRASQLGEDPDTGSLIEDLVQHQTQSMIHQTFNPNQPYDRPLWDLLIEPKVRVLIESAHISSRRERGRLIVARAIERHELPEDTDADALLDMVAGFSFYRRSMRSTALTPEMFRQVALAVAAGPPRKASPQ